MSDLAAKWEDAGFARVRAYIAAGNVVFVTKLDQEGVKTALEKRLAARAGKQVGVLVRTASEIAAVLDANPFTDRAVNRVIAIFLDRNPPPDALHEVKHRKDEVPALGAREIYVSYTEGMADSRHSIPASKGRHNRNMNTVAKLTELAANCILEFVPGPVKSRSAGKIGTLCLPAPIRLAQTSRCATILQPIGC